MNAKIKEMEVKMERMRKLFTQKSLNFAAPEDTYDGLIPKPKKKKA